MLDRYLHMLSWGFTYALFSCLLVFIYRALVYRDVIVYLPLSHGHRKSMIYGSDTILFLIMTVVSAIRLNTGSDFYNYYIYYNTIFERYHSLKDIFLQSQGGYFALSYLLRTITDFEYAIFVVIAIFSYAYLFNLIRKEVDDKPSALLTYLFLGYYAYSNNMLKQYIAMAFVMSAYLAFSKNKIVKALLFAIGAVFFHYSAAFILIIMFFVYRIKPSMKKFYLAIFGGSFGALALNSVFTLFFKLLPSASGYEKYLDWRRAGQIRLILAVLGMAIMYAILIYFIVKYAGKIRDINESRYREIIFLLVGLFINVISIRQWIMNRMAIYFYQFIILILPTLFTSLEIKQRKKLKIALYFLMFLYMIFSSIFLGENEYYSYNTIFSGEQPISDRIYNQINGWAK